MLNGKKQIFIFIYFFRDHRRVILYFKFLISNKFLTSKFKFLKIKKQKLKF